jgi:hypothetical protein
MDKLPEYNLSTQRMSLMSCLKLSGVRLHEETAGVNVIKTFFSSSIMKSTNKL